MNTVEIIGRKRDGINLSREEIRHFVNGYVQGDIEDYHAAAFLMAIYLRGMGSQETFELTMALVDSGDKVDLTDTLDFVVDKHSSGGVGDKTTLVVLPLVVSAGLPVGKMSGRGLAFSGGTLDKLESISGFNVNLSIEEFKAQVSEHSIALAGQTAQLAPADGKFYALRDVTGTVSSKPLIASSIMSKKIAGGAHGVLLDVKVGLGAFMQRLEDAQDLARIMVGLGQGAGQKVTALISDMNQPLGYAVGNALEVKEAIETLQGAGPDDFREHCLVVAGHMLRLAGKSKQHDLSDVRPILERKLSNGEAFDMFKKLVALQGGDVSQVDDPSTLPQAEIIQEVSAPRSGYLDRIDAREIGLSALWLGAGRYRKGDPVDHAVGVVVHRKVGTYVEKGMPLFTIHARTSAKADEGVMRVMNAFSWAERPGLPLFYDTIFDGDLS